MWGGPSAPAHPAGRAPLPTSPQTVEDGLDLPQFRSLSELLRTDPDFVEDARDAMVVFLDVDLPSRAVRVNITVDENVLKHIDRAASAAGETRSGFLVAAAKARLQAAE